MHSTDLVVLLLSVSGFLAVLFLWGRRSAVAKPSALNLKAKTASDFLPHAVAPLSADKTGERQLNVVFVWNGHPWDAHEVLGVPAGSSLEAVQAAYKDLIRRTDSQSRPFLDAAYTAIIKK